MLLQTTLEASPVGEPEDEFRRPDGKARHGERPDGEHDGDDDICTTTIFAPLPPVDASAGRREPDLVVSCYCYCDDGADVVVRPGRVLAKTDAPEVPPPA